MKDLLRNFASMVYVLSGLIRSYHVRDLMYLKKDDFEIISLPGAVSDVTSTRSRPRYNRRHTRLFEVKMCNLESCTRFVNSVSINSLSIGLSYLRRSPYNSASETQNLVFNSSVELITAR